MRIDNKNGFVDLKLWKNDDAEYIFRVSTQKGEAGATDDISKESAAECLEILYKSFGSFESGSFKFAFAAGDEKSTARFGVIIDKIGAPISVSSAKYLKHYIEESLKLIAQEEIQKDFSEYNPFN